MKRGFPVELSEEARNIAWEGRCYVLLFGIYRSLGNTIPFMIVR